MLEAAGGGGGTDWWGMSMEMIQKLAQSPDIDLQYQIVDGWQKSADLVAEHMGQVTDYRDALATAWPPEKSTASATYLARLDALIKNLNDTYEAALSNHEAMSSASLSLSLAKIEMSKVYSQWDTNNKTLLAFNQQQAQKQQQASNGQPMPSPSPSGDEPPPVTASQQEALRQKAITLMSSVSSDLAEAQLKVVRPAPYTPDSVVQKDPHGVGSGSTGSPVVPPIVPTPYSGGGGGSPSGTSYSPSHSSSFPTTLGGPPPAASGPNFPGSSGGNPGLVLGGANSPSTTLPPPSAGINPITSLPSGSGSITNPGILPPTTGPFLPNGNLPPKTTGSLPGEGGGFKPIGGGLSEGGLKAMPPGGIIGRTPGGGPGEPGAARFGTQRVNPVGGVIGEPGADGVGGRGAAGFSGEGMMGDGRGAVAGSRGSRGQVGRAGTRGTTAEPYGQAGGRRAGRRDQSEEMRWDPDNPWATAAGVDPVVLPPVEQRIDPGPAIGLS
jgi:hypothetical protein